MANVQTVLMDIIRKMQNVKFVRWDVLNVLITCAANVKMVIFLIQIQTSVLCAVNTVQNVHPMNLVQRATRDMQTLMECVYLVETARRLRLVPCTMFANNV